MYSDRSRPAEPSRHFMGRTIQALLLLCAVLLLTACSAPAPSPPAPTTTPYPTAETLSYTFPDMTELLVKNQQLPSRATSADISRDPHPMFKDLPRPDDFISVIYTNGSTFNGRISIFAYAQSQELDSAWPLVLSTIYTPREIEGPGELAVIDHSDIAFIRCSLLVHIRLVGADSDELLAFAEKLDADLKKAVCQDP